jgi:RES domain-containing protein
MDDPSFAGSERCTLCPAGTYSTLSGTAATRFGSRFHSIYWALILRLEFAVDAFV